MVEEIVENINPIELNDISNQSEEKEELDDIDKKRLLKEWKKSFSYYSFNPDDFKFKFSDL